MATTRYVGDGVVELIAGGGRVYADIAARFVRSERALHEIIGSPYSPDLVRNLLASGHKAALEFDYFIFGVEGYSRVAEIQLVRKRIASYMIKSGRPNKGGRRTYDVVVPRNVEGIRARVSVPLSDLTIDGAPLDHVITGLNSVEITIDSSRLLGFLEAWYDQGVRDSVDEEDLRYLKPQATEFKGIIGMNAHALLDWFQIRCCRNAQSEIRDMANKMLAICKEVAPDLFAEAGAHCNVVGYCPENRNQHPSCRGKIPTKEEVLAIVKDTMK